MSEYATNLHSALIVSETRFRCNYKTNATLKMGAAHPERIEAKPTKKERPTTITTTIAAITPKIYFMVYSQLRG